MRRGGDCLHPEAEDFFVTTIGEIKALPIGGTPPRFLIRCRQSCEAAQHVRIPRLDAPEDSLIARFRRLILLACSLPVSAFQAASRRAAPKYSAASASRKKNNDGELSR
jgi:hypothetical protein